MNIAEGIRTFELPGSTASIHPTLIWDEQTVILIDVGFSGQLQGIKQAMEEAGIQFDRLNKVMITHQDMDHLGGLQQVLKAGEGKIEVIAHPEEKPYIEGEKRPLKMTSERLAQMFGSLPEKERLAAEIKHLDSLKNKVNTTVADGERLPFCGGIVAIHTPGHTPGHICLYHIPSKTLISGDALNVVDGELMGPNPIFTPEMEKAKESLRKLIQYEIETVICYHGGVYRGKVQERLSQLSQ